MKYTGGLGDGAKAIVFHLRENGFTKESQPDRQALALGEEVGEFIGAWRRYRGMARRTDSLDHVIEELADVVITAFVTADEQGWDLDSAIIKKMNIILHRGWRENETVPQTNTNHPTQ